MERKEFTAASAHEVLRLRGKRKGRRKIEWNIRG